MPVGTVVAIVAIVAVIVVLVVVVLLVVPMMRRRRLRQRFGPEYERVMESHEGKSAAERELRERERRHAELQIRPLPPDARERYTEQWAHVQERFVDDPETAINEADRLITALMADRGYPTEGYEQQVADLSVEHAQALEHYRAAHETRLRTGDGEVSTEELRVAMVHYRTLFEDLLGAGAGERFRDERADGELTRDTRTDAVRTDAARPDAARADDTQAQDVRAEDVRAEDVRADDARAREARPDTDAEPAAGDTAASRRDRHEAAH